ncbi:hypothetical protein ACWEQ4_01190 [Rhodococcus sp. NPDC003994]
MAGNAKDDQHAVAAVLVGIGFLVWLVVEYWQVVLGGSLFFLWVTVAMVRSRRKEERRNLEWEQQMLLTDRAWAQHWDYLDGKPSGIYGDHTPEPLE